MDLDLAKKIDKTIGFDILCYLQDLEEKITLLSYDEDDIKEIKEKWIDLELKVLKIEDTIKKMTYKIQELYQTM